MLWAIGMFLLGESLTPTFSSYAGGAGLDSVRDITTDSQGNVYCVGGASQGFLATAGSFDPTQNGSVDAYCIKLSPDGGLLAATYLGGPQYDRAYAVELTPEGDVVICGRAGPGFPTTAGSFQPKFDGYRTGSKYGDQNAFVIRLSGDLRQLRWGSYFGPEAAIRDLDVDPSSGDIYLASALKRTDKAYPASWMQGSYQPAPLGQIDTVLARVTADGSSVKWASYLGGPADESMTPSVRVDAAGQPVILLYAASDGLFTSAGAYQSRRRGGSDAYVLRMQSDGTRPLAATYLGGSLNDAGETHNLALTPSGDVVIAATFNSMDMTSLRPFGGHGSNSSNGGGTNNAGDVYVAVLSHDLTTLRAGSYLGGKWGDGAEGVAVCDDGRIWVGGSTFSPDFPVTDGSRLAGHSDLFAVLLSDDLVRIDFATYQGGIAADYGRAAACHADQFLVGGSAEGSGFPLKNALQTRHAGHKDAVLTFFDGADTSLAQHYGEGMPDSRGQVPQIDLGPEVEAGTRDIRLVGAPAFAPTFLIAGDHVAHQPFAGGELLNNTVRIFVAHSDSQGRADVFVPGFESGAQAFLQFAIFDDRMGVFALSDGLAVTLPASP